MLVRGPANWPLLLVSYPPDAHRAAEELRDAWLHTLPALRLDVAAHYRRLLEKLPPMIVVLLEGRNRCHCLGHHHPKGIESRLTRRLAADIGAAVGEVDLAWEAIRDWRPQPLASLAAPDQPAFLKMHFHAAMLAVLLHELEHLAHPERAEHVVRSASDAFYTHLLGELLKFEGADHYGMAAAGDSTASAADEGARPASSAGASSAATP